MRAQASPLRKRFSASWFNADKWLLTGMRSKVLRQRITRCKRFSTAWFNTNKWFFTIVRSKMLRQIATL
jgi:hypothetical protein